MRFLQNIIFSKMIRRMSDWKLIDWIISIFFLNEKNIFSGILDTNFNKIKEINNEYFSDLREMNKFQQN